MTHITHAAPNPAVAGQAEGSKGTWVGAKAPHLGGRGLTHIDPGCGARCALTRKSHSKGGICDRIASISCHHPVDCRQAAIPCLCHES